MNRGRSALPAAALVGMATLALYRATMLPGMDLGDTPSFQARIGYPLLTPRDGYPLYTALGTLFLWVTGSDPAHALNLASVVQAAAACAVLVLAGVELTGSRIAAAIAAFFFGISYTFWSQSVIAEVYALHMLFVGATIFLALRWADRPTDGRLALLLAVYALGFGNHLSMILLAPALAVFLFTAAPGGWRSMVTPRVVAIAAICGFAGALQYGWNLRTLWLLPDPPAGLADGIQRFWFDVTKADWRETMVLQVPRAVLGDHVAMYAFDLEQQFGWAGPLLALLGLAHLARTRWRAALFLFAIYLINTLFALGYNVGDTHVFYLPSHLVVALLMAPGIVALGAIVRHRHLAAGVLIAYVALRGWRDYPALDRSGDDRPRQLIGTLTAGLNDRDSILLTDLNWQVQNGLSYYGLAIAPEIAYTRMPEVILYAPSLIADNLAIDREIVLTARARAALGAAYGPLLDPLVDPRVAEPTLADAARALPGGIRYVLCILKPTRDLTLDWEDIGGALSRLAGEPVDVPAGDYVAIAGVSGQPPAFSRGSDRPFRDSFDLDGVPVSIRMESWLAADTIRRMGFGHAIAGRRHTLIVERGVSFAAFDESGRPLRTVYAANIFAPERRYLIRR